MFLPKDAQFTHVAALLNSKQVDSICKHQRHHVSKRRENFLNTQPTQNGLHGFLFPRLNFAALTQMRPGAECSREPARDPGIVLMGHTARLLLGSAGPGNSARRAR